MGRHDPQETAWFGNPMQFADKPQHIRDMFDDVLADDLVELIVLEGVGEDPQIVNHLGMTKRIGVDTDRPGNLILPAADVKNSFLKI